MKRCFVTLAVLLSSFFLLAMSGSPKEDPKNNELLGPKVEVQTGEGFITLDELHRIAINVYKYEFEEEHEWKNLKRKDSEGLIKNIIPVKENLVIVAYIVNYNPTGHIVICANKSFGPPVDVSGSQGHWDFDLKGENYLSSYDSRLHPMVRDGFHRMKVSNDEGKDVKRRRDQEFWDRYNVPVDSFNLRADYENNTYKPDWWLEKKKSKNTDGMIKTEWHQRYPFYNSCPVQSDTTLVGCNPLAMSQLMKYYSYPPKGLENLSSSTYDWSYMLAYDSLMTTSTYRIAVAKICFDAGVATNAIWGTDSTSVFFDNVPSGLGKIFNYTAQLKSKASWDSSIDTWIARLIGSIGEGKPVIYGGYYSDVSFSGKHTWIVDQYNSDNDRFHFNMGWENISWNDWYQTDKILTSHYAVFNIIPDKSDNCLSLPYKEDFQGSDVVTGTEICQIPKNIAVSHTVAPDSTLAIFTREYDLTNHLRAMNVRNYGENNQWFIIKKINLTCDSVPVLKFSYYVNDQNGLTSGTDAIIVEVSNNNRETWNQIYKLDQSNYLTANYKNFVETYVSLKEYKGSIANIRFRFPYSGSADFCLIDDIEVNSMSLSFPELASNIILPSKTAQSIKVQPSFGTPPKKDKSINSEVLMDFYIKQDDGESEYTLVYTDSVIENGIYEYPNWNTKSSLGIPFKIRAVARTYDNSSTITSSEVNVKIKCEPTIESPLPSEIFYTHPSSKSSATDTLAIKVRVPEVLGSYPAINIKIDGTYVNQGDITFNSTENVWIYNWDLSTASPTESGKMYIITAEMEDDTTDFYSTGIYLVEALFYENFETMTSLTGAGWTKYSWETPELAYTGWWLDVDAVDPENRIALTLSQHSNTLTYWIQTPSITIPSDPNRVTMVSYRVYYGEFEAGTPFSKLYFCVYDQAGNPTIVPAIQIAAINNQWATFTYDLSSYAGQTIKLEWHNNYSSSTIKCKYTAFCLDDVMVYSLPDIDGPEIDFIAGNTADLNEDMNLNIGFNDNSGINGVTADYSIDGYNNSITLYPVKGTYTYTGTIPAKDHECVGSISFKIKDSVGNETVSGGHAITWVVGGGSILTTPENVVIAQPTSTTISITWDLVDGATSYKVYSSTDPYGTFAEDTTGTFTESRKWEKTVDGTKYFYYVVAVNASKYNKSIIETSGNQVK